MQKVFCFLAVLLLAAFSELALAQDQVRTPEELAKLPMYERLLEGDDAKKAEELQQGYEEALEAESWAEAKKFAQALVDLRIREQGADHYEVTDARQMLVLVEIQSSLAADERRQLAEADQQNEKLVQLYQQGQFQKAAEIGENVLVTRKKLLGENHLGYASNLIKLSVLYGNMGEYSKALQLNLQALDLYKKLLGEDHPDYARCLNNLAGLFWRMGEYAKAKPLHEQALFLRKKLLGENHPEYAQSLHNLAALYVSMGEYAKAKPLHVEAHDLRKKLLGENNQEYADSLDSLARLYLSMGEFAKAEPLFLQNRDLRKKLLGENHPDYAKSLSGLASLYRLMGSYAKAEPLNLQALDLCKKLLGENHPDYAICLNNLATLYLSMGEYAKAEPLYLQARDRFKLLGENHPLYASSLNALAALYVYMGEYAKAKPLYEQAIFLRKTLLGENNPEYAQCLHNLAVLYKLTGDYAKAEPLYLRARDLRKVIQGENHPDYATILDDLGAMYGSMGEYSNAEELLLQAREIHKNSLGENHPNYAICLHNLAFLYNEMGNWAKAEPVYLQARDLSKMQLGESHPNYATSLNNLATLYISMGEYAKAESELVECTRSFEMSRIARAGGFQRAIGGGEGNPYLALASVSVHLKKPRQGFVALERNLSRAFLDVQAQRRSQSLTADQQARQFRILMELSPIDKRIAVLVGRADLTHEETNELAEKIISRSQLNVELAELAAELSTQEVSDFAAIQEAIPAGHALLTWVDESTKGVLEEHWACVLTSSGEPFWLLLSGSGESGKWTKEDSQLAFRFHDAVAQPVPPSNLSDLIEQLRRQRIEPVLAHLKEQGITQLHVVGFDQMAGLPVEVIAPEFTISYVPSGTFLARLPEKPKYENTLFAVGDPIYEVERAKQQELTALPPHGLLIDALAPGGKAEELGLNPGQVLLQYGDTKLASIDDLKAAVQKASEAGTNTVAVTVWKVDDADKVIEQAVEFPVGPLGVILSPDPAPVALVNRRKTEALFVSLRGGEVWEDLPGTRYEVQQLSNLFPASTVLLDDQASEVSVDALRQSDDLSRFRYLHFATHGKGNSVTAFESKLVLSQDQPKGDIKAGEPWYNNEISAREVLDYWKLNADLVTLSACQTGLGRQGGGEGLLGFAQAFLLAGSRSVCLSLWEVDDIATALLMQRFYQNLLGQREGLNASMPKAKALAEAKDWLRNLTATEATALTAQLTGGIARGTRQEKTFKVPPPSTPAEIAAGDDYKPYARPHYWSAFILIGEPE